MTIHAAPYDEDEEASDPVQVNMARSTKSSIKTTLLEWGRDATRREERAPNAFS